MDRDVDHESWYEGMGTRRPFDPTRHYPRWTGRFKEGSGWWHAWFPAGQICRDTSRCGTIWYTENLTKLPKSSPERLGWSGPSPNPPRRNPSRHRRVSSSPMGSVTREGTTLRQAISMMR